MDFLKGIGWKEALAVGAVGAGLAFGLKKVPLAAVKKPLVAGALLYTAGYVVAQHRPEGGWKMLEG